MSQYALIAPSIQIAGNVVTRNRKSVVNLSVAEHFHDQLMADPMENVLSCAAVLATRAPLATVLMCSVWGLTFEDLKISARCRAPHLHDLLSIPRLYHQF